MAKKNLVIVESPAKAKTIEKFLGKDFMVKSSFGHIRDLPKKNISIDVENNFVPQYEISPDKKKIIAELKKDAKASETVWLASDEDREGEAIAWHLFEALGLKESNTKRIVFNEITKTAILAAIKNPRKIDMNLVNAQQARRILDRLVGYKVSPILWKKIKPSLSAGRVQSVAVRLIVEREREIRNFKSENYYRLIADFSANSQDFKAEVPSKIKSKAEVLAFLESCKASKFIVSDIEKKPTKKSPAPPFTTSSLQQEASRKLGYSVSQTMLVAQKLYEGGFITYMRTDSVNLSKQAMSSANSVIIKEFGEEFAKTRYFKSKIKGAQEAHEAIRPSNFNNFKAGRNSQEQRLYNLIWKRALASQMAEAKIEKTTIKIEGEKLKQHFVVKGEMILFAGFLKLYVESTDDDKEEEGESYLPKLKVNEKVDLLTINATERFTKHPARYAEASLVRKLEELGIGRPSTYAPTISTIIKREYIVKEDRDGKERNYILIKLENNEISEHKNKENYGAERKKLFPTDTGIVVTDFLVENFDKILKYSFTAGVEEEFDNIASGKANWTAMLTNFYKPFEEKIKAATEKEGYAKGERVLGKDPETGKPISVRMGRYGSMVQIGTKDDDEKPKFASLMKDQNLSTITLEEALELFKLPPEGRLLGEHPEKKKKIFARLGRFGAMVQLGELKDEEKPTYASLKKGQDVETISLEEAIDLLKLPRTVGEYEGKTVVAAVGRFGPYLRHDSKFTSIKKDEDPLTIELDRAIELIEEKRNLDKEKLIKTFAGSELKIMKDRWKNPCVYYKKKYTRLTKKENIEEMTLEECFKFIGIDPTKEKKKTTKKITKRKKK